MAARLTTERICLQSKRISPGVTERNLAVRICLPSPSKVELSDV